MTTGASAPAASGQSSGELAKAFLTNLENNEQIECKFNPTQYSLSKSNTWDAPNIVGMNVPPTQFKGGSPTSLDLELFFDTYEDQQDVRDYTDKLFALAKISSETVDSATNRGRPPRCMFNWGRVFNFQAVVTSFSVRYTLFLADGTPVRATVNITLQEAEDEDAQPPQNPTSQGAPGHRVYLVKPGDTIDLIAYRHYGDSKVWRFLADVNHLENPMELQPGTALEIRPLGQ